MQHTTALAWPPWDALGTHCHPGERVRSLMCEVRSPTPAERGRASLPLRPDDRMDVVASQAVWLEGALELLVPFGDDAAWLRGSLGSRSHRCGLSLEQAEAEAVVPQ